MIIGKLKQITEYKTSQEIRDKLYEKKEDFSDKRKRSDTENVFGIF